MSASNSLHYRLCVEGAKWLHRKKHDYKKCDGRECERPEFCKACVSYKYVAVELNTYGIEQCDVWGWNGYVTAVIEVKTSHNDFLNDRKKECRQDEYKDMQCGNYRWYLCPEGVIKPEEIPEGWGLLYWNNGVRSFISEVKNDVIGAVSAGAVYLDEVDIRYKVIAYKFLSMKYGLEFWVDWKDWSDCEVSYGFSIAIKKSK